jgi:AcrR family transcriptional regulator|tara:strand:- start:1914 stop:2576 length:663 start_codon:yes stop_codon:yes gene_type:complete
VNAEVATLESTELGRRLRSVPAPRPVLERDHEARLTARQREVLDRLGTLFDDGFAELTMADIAANVGCSLRTLYDLAPSRDELVLTVIDLNLRRIGRRAISAIQPDLDPLVAIRSYLTAANEAVAATTPAFARDQAATPATHRLATAHSDYLVAITRALLDLAVERGDIAPTDTAAVARVVAGLGAMFALPGNLETIDSTPKEAADSMVDVILRGLTTGA